MENNCFNFMNMIRLSIKFKKQSIERTNKTSFIHSEWKRFFFIKENDQDRDIISFPQRRGKLKLWSFLQKYHSLSLIDESSFLRHNFFVISVIRSNHLQDSSFLQFLSFLTVNESLGWKRKRIHLFLVQNHIFEISSQKRFYYSLCAWGFESWLLDISSKQPRCSFHADFWLYSFKHIFQ